MLDSLDVVNKDDIIEWIYSLQVLPTEDSEWVFSILFLVWLAVPSVTRVLDLEIFVYSQTIIILGWLKSSFGFFVTSYRKTRTNFSANPVFHSSAFSLWCGAPFLFEQGAGHGRHVPWEAALRLSGDSQLCATLLCTATLTAAALDDLDPRSCLVGFVAFTGFHSPPFFLSLHWKTPCHQKVSFRPLNHFPR